MKQFVGPFPMVTPPARDGVYGVILKPYGVEFFGFAKYAAGAWMLPCGTAPAAGRSTHQAEFFDDFASWFGTEQ